MKNNVKVLRAMKNITQDELAAAVGVSRQSIVALEANKYNCSVKVAYDLAEFFGLTMNDIFFGDDKEMRYPSNIKSTNE